MIPFSTPITDIKDVTIGFHYIDSLGNEYSAESTESEYELSSALEKIGEKLNAFLKQAGFWRPGDYIYMDSLTEDEYDAVDRFMVQYREERKSN